MPHAIPTNTAALASAMSQIDRAFAGRKGPPARHAPLFAVRDCSPRPVVVSPRTAAKNRAGLASFVERHVRIAAGLPYAEAEAHRETTAQRLNAMLSTLEAEGPTPQWLRGLTAWEIAEARDDMWAERV